MRRIAALSMLMIMTGAAALATPASTWRQQAPPAEVARFDRLCARVESAYDTARGGYADRAGVPCEAAAALALTLGEWGAGEPWAAHARRTLLAVNALADSNGGGYYDRPGIADDPRGLIDKSTAVHARRLELMIQAWRVTGDPAYRAQAARVVDFADRILMDARGGFVVAQVGDREPLPEPNGLMIHAWLQWAAATSDPRVRDFALRSIDRTWGEDWSEPLGLVRTGEFGPARPRSMLIDQAEMGRALVLAARLAGRPTDRERAVKLGELLLARYEDTAKGGFRSQLTLTRDGDPKRSARGVPDNARAASFLYELGRLTGDARFRAAADRAVAAFDDDVDRMGLDAAGWALAVRSAWSDDLPATPAWRVLADGEHREPARSRTYRTGAR